MSNQPNIVQVIWHDVGRHLACYQQGSVRSPSLDRMAAEGVLFERHFSTGAVCVPSRCSILTGQYPHTHSLWRCNPESVALPAILRKVGYHTVRVGFCEEEEFFPDNDNIDLSQFAMDTLGYSYTWSESEDSHALARAACNILDSRSSQQPLYLCIEFSDVHRPNDIAVTHDEVAGTLLPSYLPQLPNTVASREDFARLEKQIQYADAAIGYILDKLHTGGYHENTLVLFTADHGIDYPRAKMTLYDPGIETALICWGKGCGAGLRDSKLHSHMDILPTLLDYLGLPPEPTVQGVSFAPALSGGSYHCRTDIYAQRGWETDYNRCHALRTERYKYIVHEQAGNVMAVPPAYREAVGAALVDGIYTAPLPLRELYDLWNDPHELDNLAGDRAMQQTLAVLDSRLGKILDLNQRSDLHER